MDPINNNNIVQSQNILDPKRQRGTGFTNIGRILQQNQGAGARMGQGVAGVLSGQAQNIGQNINQAQTQFKDQYNTNRAGALQDIQQAGAFAQQPGSTSINDYSTNVANLAQDKNIDEIGRKFREANYGGPTGLTNQQNILNQAQSVANTGVLAGTQLGQGMLARQLANRSRYTQGQNALDRALMSRDAQAQQAIRSAGREAGAVMSQAQTAVGEAQAAANAAQKGIEQQRDTTMKNLLRSLQGEDATSGYTGGILGAAEQQAKAFGTDVNTLNSLLGSIAEGKLPDDYAAKQADYDRVLANMSDYGFDPTNVNAYLSAGLVSGQGSSSVQNINQLLGNIGKLQSSINIAPQEGALRFKGDQEKAASILANLTANQGAKQAIESQKLNEDVIEEENFLEELAATGQEWTAKDEAAKKQAEWIKNNYSRFIDGIMSGAVARPGGWVLPKNRNYQGIVNDLNRNTPDYYSNIFTQTGNNPWETLTTAADQINNKLNTINQYIGSDISGADVQRANWGQLINLGHDPAQAAARARNLNLQNFQGQNQALMSVLQNLVANQGKFNPQWNAGGNA